MRIATIVAVGLTSAVIAGSLVHHYFMTSSPPDERILPPQAVDESVAYSNILPEDYVGPEVCAQCHQQQYTHWLEHPHRLMNQLPSPASVQGDFNDTLLTLPTGEIRFTTDEDGEYWMTVRKIGETYRRYQVTRTVGTKYMQFYIGKQIEGPEAAGHDIYREHMLPFSYWFKIKRWLPRQFFDPDGPEQLKDGIPQCEAVDRMPDVRGYSAMCMNCHNTFSYAYRIFKSKLVGFPDAIVAAAIEPLSEALSPTIDVAPTLEGFNGLNARLDPDQHLVTLGISCESCHFGGREHTEYEREIRFLPTSKYTRITPKSADKPLTGSRENAPTVSGICVQCHSGGGRRYPNGAIKSNSREGLDMHAGFCTTELRCVDCHEPHTKGVRSGGPDIPQHIDVCVNCHDQYRDPAEALAHSGHTATANVNCLDCHMPRYTQGLDELIRTHRICMPVEESMVAAGSANACNLCHLDQSLRWTLTELERGWGRKLSPQWAWASYDQLDQPVGQAWLHGKDIHLRLVATQSYARSPMGQDMLPEIIRALNDPEPINRVFAGFATRRLLGRPMDDPLQVEITAPPAVRARQIGALLDQLEKAHKVQLLKLQ